MIFMDSNYKSNVVVSDYDENYGINVEMRAGSGVVSVNNYGDYSTVYAAQGRHYINNNAGPHWGWHSTLVSYYNGAVFHSSIVANTLVGAEMGTTFLYEFNKNYDAYNYTVDDVILNYNETDTIRFVNDTFYSTMPSGKDVIISFERGSTRVVDASGKTLNIVGGFINSIDNSTAYITVRGTAANDSINNTGGYTRIEAGDGDDLIIGDTTNDYLQTRVYTPYSIDGGAGNDSIDVRSPGAIAYGGDGNDSIKTKINGNISTSIAPVTVWGGAGNDYIENENTLSGNIYVYGSNDGADTIESFNPSLDSIYIVDGSTYSTVHAGRAVNGDLTDIIHIGSTSVYIPSSRYLYYIDNINIIGGRQIDYVEPQAMDISNSRRTTIPSGTLREA